MSLLELIVLSIVQGVTEFLPISSSGHLVVLENLFGMKQDLTDLNIVLHAGTLVSILFVYRQRVLEMLFRDPRLLSRVVVGTLPAVAIGLVIKLRYESLLESSIVAGCCLPLTGTVLFWCHHQRPTEGTISSLTFRQSLLIGFCQAIAVLPGISRSGTTIAGGLWVGLRREDAATFSFLLAIPTLCGAVLLEAVSLAKGEGITLSLGELALGAGIAAVVGIVSLKGLLIVLEKGSLRGMGLWCLVLGILVLVREVIG